MYVRVNEWRSGWFEYLVLIVIGTIEIEIEGERDESLYGNTSIKRKETTTTTR